MTPRLTVYYDGLCPLCSREIAHYRRLAPAGTTQFIDIATPDFDAAEHGLDADAIHRHLHVKFDGQVRTGVDAFLAIWEVIPGFLALKAFVTLPGIYTLCTLFYELFARLRPLLPKRKCEGGVCSR